MSDIADHIRDRIKISESMAVDAVPLTVTVPAAKRLLAAMRLADAVVRRSRCMSYELEKCLGAEHRAMDAYRDTLEQS